MRFETMRVPLDVMDPEFLTDGRITDDLAQRFVGLRATGHSKADGFLADMTEVVTARVVEDGQAVEIDVVWTFDRP